MAIKYLTDQAELKKLYWENIQIIYFPRFLFLRGALGLRKTDINLILKDFTSNSIVFHRKNIPKKISTKKIYVCLLSSSIFE